MKKLVALLFVSMIASVAFAGLDQDPDQLGIYFDTAGNANCAASLPLYQNSSIYVLLMNPTTPTKGFEFTYSVTGAPAGLNLSAAVLPAGAVDVDGSANGFAVGLAAAIPAAPAVLLATIPTFYFNTDPLAFWSFKLGPAAIPSLPGGYPVVDGGVGYGLRRMGVASGDIELPVARLGAGMCPVADEASSFGSVKSLFR